METVKKFIELTATAVAIRDSKASWDTKFDIIFSPKIFGAIEKTEIDFKWTNPDMDYEDDVRAYVAALEEKSQDLSLILESVEKTD